MKEDSMKRECVCGRENQQDREIELRERMSDVLSGAANESGNEMKSNCH